MARELSAGHQPRHSVVTDVNELPSYGCFILDMDGTIADTIADNVRSANRALEQLGLPQRPFDEVASYFGGGIPLLMQRCLDEDALPLLDDAVEACLALYHAEPTAESRVYPGVIEALETITGAGAPVAICTQTPESLTTAILDGLDLARFVDVVVGPESVTHRKPHPEPVWKILKHLDASAADTIFVGDSATDIQAARAAGVTSCAANYGYTGADGLAAVQPDLAIDAFSDLLSVVHVRNR